MKGDVTRSIGKATRWKLSTGGDSERESDEDYSVIDEVVYGVGMPIWEWRW